MNFTTIAPKDFYQLQQQNPAIEVIDVRTPAEFGSVHATGVKNVPLDALNVESIKQSRAGKKEPLYVICQSGARAKKACDQLLAAGVAVVSIEGGTNGWVAAGLPVKKGKGVISLERQVRIAAGSLAFTGAILALTVHPYFAGLSAFIGAGLVFAGVTDTCGMGMMLAKMPWNSKAAQSSATCETPVKAA